MDSAAILKLIDNEKNLNDATLPVLEQLVEEYPYFQTARLLLAKNRHLANHEMFEACLGKTAVFAADRRRLFYLINSRKYARFFPKEETLAQTDRTQTLLDSYLEKYSEEAVETQKTELNIATTDYLTYLENLKGETSGEQDAQQEFKHQDIIDNFLEKAEANEIAFAPPKQDNFNTQSSDNEINGDGFLTETLAKIYIKQKKYEQALAIFQRLSLNFPKKSVYFADQIRFLELLILNEKNKKQ